MRAKALIIFVVVLTLYLQITAVSASQIILEDADTIWNTTTPYSEDLTNVTSDVKTRIQTEYANTIYHNNLNPSTDLFNLTTNVTPRILAEYANTFYRNELKEIPDGLANITGEVPPKIIIVHAKSNYYEALIFPKELINDATSPIITNVIAIEITNNSATLKWDTDEIADSLVKYGKTSGSYTESEGDSLFVKNHAIELTGLLPGTGYYFVVNSTDQSGNSKESIEYEFVTIGKLKVFDINSSLTKGWNLISVPLNLNTWKLGEESVVGDPLNVTPRNSLTSIYRYNSSTGSFDKCDYIDDWGWAPATGSESFAELKPGRGYWVRAENACNLTFTGTQPSDLDVTLKENWNLIGWYSQKKALLGNESVVGDPLNVTPENSLSSVYRYNYTTGSFDKCDHLVDWGWAPATRSKSFTALEPCRGYWVSAEDECVWWHKI